ncbi:MAG: glycoside hydrolase family 9 protein, partial [Ignavibacteriales bacterium]|nr:glycoside hydrolase family 9 protein [Ignavibacteriales bacterium]
MDLQKKLSNLILLLISVTSISCSASQPLQENLYIRVNQVGYLPAKPKHAVIFAEKAVKTTEFKLIDAKSGKEVYKGSLSGNLGSWGDFGFNYKIDFSDFAVTGKYRVVAGGKQSSSFSINAGIYSTVADSLLEFFKIQRCGPTNPKMHKICHIYDSPRVDGDNSVTGIDVTGGLHDAGDYIKFLNTSAYTTYMLLLSYDLNRSVSNFDNDRNSVPDILEEAKVGIDWLIRCNYKDTKLITQVQDNRDHEQGWRLPENDPIKFDRPAFAGRGKSIIGLYSATLALAAKIWRDRFKDDAAADRFLAIAEKMYAIRGSVPDVDVTNTGMYSDRNYLGKLALGAIELYNATKKENYLLDAKEYSGKAKSDYWWSWGDMNSLAHFRIGAYARENIDFINSNLIHFNSSRQKNIYEEGAAFSWGTTNTLLGCALQAVFFKISTGKND